MTGHHRYDRPLVGYGLVFVAALLAGLNATLGKIVMDSGGLSALRVSEVRSTGSAVLLIAAMALFRRSELRVRREDLRFLVLFGLFGLAIAQYLYFVSIKHLHIGVALVITNLAIVLVALWARFFGSRPVHPRLWVGIVLALAGLALVARVWSGAAFDALGIAASLGCACAYATYLLMAERSALSGRPAYALIGLGFVVAGIFWAIAQPWWTFPYEILGKNVSLLGRLDGSTAPVWLLLGVMVPFGSLAPFVLYASALRYIPATHVVIAAVSEPVLGAVIAFGWLGETLGVYELVGGLLVLVAVVITQTAQAVAPEPARPAVEPRAERVLASR